MDNQNPNPQTGQQTTINVQVPSASNIASRRPLIPASFALAIIFFFFTFCDFKCGGQKIGSVTGINMVTGTELKDHDMFTGREIKGKEIPSSMWAILAFGAAIIGLGAFLIKEKREAIIGAGAGAIGAGSLIILQFVVKSAIDKEAKGQVDVEFQFPYWGALIAMGVGGLISYLRMKQTHNIVFTTSAQTNQPQAEAVVQTVVQEAPKTVLQQPISSFDIAEWFGKNFKKIIIAATAIIVLGGGGYFVYKNYLVDDPVRDGLKSAKMNCELAVNNTDRVIELRKEYMTNFNSYNFKNRKGAIDKFDDMCKGQLTDYNTNFTKSNEFYISKRNMYMSDPEKLAQFDASHNQYTCVGGKDYELDQLLNKQWDLINTTFPQQNNVTPQQVAPSSATNNSSSTQGNFPQASERLLTSSDLSGMSKQDLKIMRNEIFARHGYIFKTAEMKSYFANQSWYSGQYDDVTSMLSTIEKQNVELIKKYE